MSSFEKLKSFSELEKLIKLFDLHKKIVSEVIEQVYKDKSLIKVEDSK